MKLLHTADLHLRDDDKQRWTTFEWICQKALDEKVRFLVIAGDVFNRAKEASPELIKRIRERFESLKGIRVIIIPGNHDQKDGPDPFIPRNYYGENVSVCCQRPYEILEENKVVFYCFPFQPETSSREVFQKFKLKENGGLLHLGVMHGTLIDDENIRNYAKEVEQEYFPIYRQDIEEAGFDYLALGHIHKKFWQNRIGKTEIVYPGTPEPWKSTEEEERKVALVRLDDNGVRVKDISVEPALKVIKWSMRMRSDEEEKTIKEIKGYLEEKKKDPKAKSFWAVVEIDGLVKDEQMVNKSIDRLKEDFRDVFGNMDIRNRIKGVGAYLDYRICSDFIEKIEDKLQGAKMFQEKEKYSRALGIGLEALRKVGRLG